MRLETSNVLRAWLESSNRTVDEFYEFNDQEFNYFLEE